MRKLFTFILMLLPVLSSAFTGKVEINGIYYNLTTKANVAEVTYGDVPYSVDVINIPSSVEYEGTTCNVISIGEKAFFECTLLERINLPNSIKEIKGYAFYKCSRLKEIIIPENVTNIESGAFWYCTAIEALTIKGSLDNFSRAFGYCESLNSVYIKDLASWCKLFCGELTCSPLHYASHFYVNGEEITDLIIPGTVNQVGNSFWGFSGLKSVYISEGVKEIGAVSFGNCKNLIKVTIANTVKKIDYNAFQNCTTLESITIPNSVTYIGENDFRNCTNLKEVIIGSGLDYLGPASFSNCTELTDVYVYTNSRPKTYYDNAFSNSDINYATLHVRESLIPSFKSDIPWKNFGTIVRVPEISYMVDGEIYMKDVVMVGTPITPITEPEKEGHTFSGWSGIPEIMPKEDVTVTGTFTVNTYMLTYLVDGEVYQTSEVKYGTTIIPEEEPTKTGYTFSGWSSIPTTMPAHDVTVNGTFTINKYKLTYIVDNEEYKTVEVDYNSNITPEAEPTKEGHTFSGWSEIPETMPANDVTVTGSFTVNSYNLTYIVDEVVYKTYEVKYGTTITPEEEPTRTGYSFSGWSEFPSTMPAKDITITGSFIINKYKLTYLVDGIEYKSLEVEYNASISPETEPTKEGHTFSGWSEIPETMPANDVIITGTFTINKYLVTYIIDGETFTTEYVKYASTITPPSVPEREGYSFAWNEYPETMPANDISITGQFTINSYKLTYFVDGAEYKSYDVVYKSTITPEAEPTKEGHTFSGWSEIPETMPANDVTITGSFIVNKYKVTYIIDGEVFATDYVEYGSTIVPPTVSEKEGFTFDGWANVPETMPAHDVTIYGSYTSGIAEIIMNSANVRIYNINGKRINKLQRGINIIIGKDGKVRKVNIK